MKVPTSPIARFKQSVLTLALIGGLTACGGETDPAANAMPAVPVVVNEVTPVDVPLTTEMVGETAGFREIEVRSRVSGILLKRTYVEGQPVTAGQELFLVDPAPYKVALEQAKGTLAQEQARLNKARADKDRIIPLFKRQVVSRKDYDDTIANYEAAVASLQAAQAKVKEADLNLSYTQVTAPISGMASKSSQSEGSLISTSGDSSLLTTITQFDPLYVNFSYSEQDRLNFEKSVKKGLIEAKSATDWRTHIQLADGSTYPEPGRLNFSDTRVDPQTGTIRARAIFDNKDGALLPGQFVRLTIDLGTRKNAIVVPPRAIVQSQADRLVMVVDADNKVSPRPVKLGPTVSSGIIIDSGLQAGDRYIVEGLMKARPGAVVKPVSAEEMKAINAKITQGAAGK
ncbi:MULTISPECIES: efflux RND transporter periplasmic adaptor subunit [Aeromonas]|uniref:Efflux RND transporter periplasmic adaptor subunit n=2 Tax=Aeromonas TaxID=642 RepID=A0A175VJA8_AEREN|nr:efflux RND transporter periplasmic adaptor subunit [Aeromonas enteropelogenes]KXU80547.1 efflux transporter periplasmic adaptor subunit [Aeromonas enteropelogenes]MBL0521244.1 efflux RND transporter periplasmic adaptor subunit [Aeromonas enteropelogenes]MCZ0752734.1 efflux RND transporter periplasmic adaptor subunit [Aeromonas enteropelogenes]UAK71090.1 efflux RND transporter periplasmic adaptor subunit [Aeromonas enteropelogenes]UBH26868.1 efflux RND transporter periplasmic adaptor subunit